jgi:uncharacterized protein
MKIRLDKIGAEPHEWRESVSIPAAKLDRTQLLSLSDVSWVGRVWMESPGFRVEASFSYQQTVACDRCLSPLDQQVEGEIGLILISQEPQLTDEEVELTAEDLQILYLEDDEFDPEQILIEQLQLNVPMRAICGDDCQGLCPDCGINRNLETCSCQEARIDPRWEALRGLKDEN